MALYCCIGGHVPQEPVVSKLNGALYDKRLIEGYIREHGRCPKTNEPMRLEDLVPIHGGVAAASASAAPGAQKKGPGGPEGFGGIGGVSSIPAMLATLQGEWDNLLLEQFSLRQQLATAQQELAHALYKHEAACRVITKLVQERDDALRAAGQEPSAASAQPQQQIPSDPSRFASSGGLPTTICDEIDANAARLKAQRKRRDVAHGTVTAADLEGFTEVADLTLPHMNASGSAVGVLCCSAQDINGAKVIFTGGADGRAVCYDVNRNTVVGTLLGHTRAIRRIDSALDFVMTCSDDGTARVWRSDTGNYRCTSLMKGHVGGVSGFAMLPSFSHAITGGVDGSLLFQDIETGVCIAGGKVPNLTASINAVALHPDGFMGATGSGATVHLWDLKQMSVDTPLPLPPGHGNISSIAFNEDGYSVAVGTAHGVVQLFDLRRTDSPMLAPVVFDDNPSSKPVPVGRVNFDPSGQYLAVAINNVKILSVKDLNKPYTLNVLNSHLAGVTDVSWGPKAQWLVSSSWDKHTKIYAGAGK